jgi:hypothetical protein
LFLDDATFADAPGSDSLAPIPVVRGVSRHQANKNKATPPGEAFAAHLALLRRKKWFLYAKPPPSAGPGLYPAS